LYYTTVTVNTSTPWKKRRTEKEKFIETLNSKKVTHIQTSLHRNINSKNSFYSWTATPAWTSKSQVVAKLHKNLLSYLHSTFYKLKETFDIKWRKLFKSMLSVLAPEHFCPTCLLLYFAVARKGEPGGHVEQVKQLRRPDIEITGSNSLTLLLQGIVILKLLMR
jgi:hypothetical protein